MNTYPNGDGATNAPPVINRNDQFKGQNFAPGRLGPEPQTYRSKREAIAGNAKPKRREEHTGKLDWIEIFLLLYTGGHNLYNAFERAQESWWMFAFIAGGVISMEWFLFQGQKAIKAGEYTLRQKRVFRGWGSVFFLFIILGVLTATQAVDGVSSWFIDIHYHWILPLGTVLLLPALWHLRSADEILKADNEAANLELLTIAEEKRAKHADKYMDLMRKREQRLHVWNLRNMLGKRIDKLVQGIFSNGNTKTKIEIKAKEEVPLLLEKAGITSTEPKPVKK